LMGRHGFADLDLLEREGASAGRLCRHRSGPRPIDGFRQHRPDLKWLPATCTNG
jgi:hypothetical protein